MAKIPVEKKQQSSWIWWVLGLLAVAGLIWILVEAFDDEEDVDVGDVEEVEPVPTPATPGPEEVDIQAILANPDEYIGEPFPSTEVSVSSVPTDRGFWITGGGDSLFAIIIDTPEEQPKDINPGQTLHVEGGTLHDSSYLPDLPGVPLDAATEGIAEDQPLFLVVDERNIEIHEAGMPQPGTDPADTLQ